MSYKTPVSMLQEFTIKMGYVPHYEEMKNEANQSFTFSVKFEEYQAKGTACNKKQAKQTAATEMLLLLMENQVIPKIPEILSLKREPNMSSCSGVAPPPSPPLPSSPSSSQLVTNYVGKVNEYCVQKNLPDPVYEIIDINGGPHCPEFTMSCTACSMYEEASATNKKTAKQNVAKKIWEKIQINNYVCTDDEVSEYNGPDLLKKVRMIEVMTENITVTEKCKEAVDFYRVLKGTKLSSIPIAKHHLLFLHKYNKIMSRDKMFLLGKITTQENFQNAEQTGKLIASITKCFNFKVEEIHVATHETKCKVVGIRISDEPIIVQFGIGETIEEAKHKAVFNVIMRIMEYLT